MSNVRITKTKDEENADDPKGIITIEIDGKEISLPPMGQSLVVNIETSVSGTRLEYSPDGS